MLKKKKKYRGRSKPVISSAVSRIILTRRLKLLFRKIFSIIVILSILVVIIAVIFFWYRGTFAYAWYRISSLGFAVTTILGLELKHVFIGGQNHASMEDIEEALGVKVGMPILDIDLPQAKSRLENIGWVKQAKVARQLPHALHVSIIERTPFAIWQYQGILHLIDEQGVIITREKVSDFRDLPLLVGENARFNTSGLLKILKHNHSGFSNISSATWVGSRRWDIKLNNGIIIKLPEEDPESAWKTIMNLQKEKGLLDRDIEIVDLRIPSKLVITPRKQLHKD